MPAVNYADPTAYHGYSPMSSLTTSGGGAGAGGNSGAGLGGGYNPIPTQPGPRVPGTGIRPIDSGGTIVPKDGGSGNSGAQLPPDPTKSSNPWDWNKMWTDYGNWYKQYYDLMGQMYQNPFFMMMGGMGGSGMNGMFGGQGGYGGYDQPYGGMGGMGGGGGMNPWLLQMLMSQMNGGGQ